MLLCRPTLLRHSNAESTGQRPLCRYTQRNSEHCAGTPSKDTESDECENGTYSDGSFQTCKPHSKCEDDGCTEIKKGTPSSDTECKSQCGLTLGHDVQTTITYFEGPSPVAIQTYVRLGALREKASFVPELNAATDWLILFTAFFKKILLQGAENLNEDLAQHMCRK
ncbi:hypothetical protein MHYP_G00325980 [Metynnis hypsauchen]